jgi:HEAT repeats
MIDALAFGSVSLFAVSAMLLVLIVVRRVAFARQERVRLDAEERLRPFALALVAGDGDGDGPPPLAARDAVVFAGLLARYARRLHGDSAARIAAYFERSGVVAREIAALGDRRAWRRATAAYALGDMSSETAVPPLLEGLRDPAREVRAAAARSLGRLGAVEAVEPLVEALAAQQVPPAVAGFALVQIGPAALPSLTGLLAHDDAGVRASAAELVGLIGDAGDGRPLLAGLQDSSAEVRARSARALGRLGDDEATARLLAALDDRVPFVRTATARALGAIGDSVAFDALLEQARTDSFDPAHAAACALAAVDPPRAEEAAASPDAGVHVLEAADLAVVSA